MRGPESVAEPPADYGTVETSWSEGRVFGKLAEHTECSSFESGSPRMIWMTRCGTEIENENEEEDEQE
jgi:hypothetical protein